MKLHPLEPSEHIETLDDIRDYLEIALEDASLEHLAGAASDVIKAIERMQAE